MVFISNTRCITSVFIKLCTMCIVVFIRIVRLIFSANFETPLYCQYYDLMYKRKRTIHADASTFWSNDFKRYVIYGGYRRNMLVESRIPSFIALKR